MSLYRSRQGVLWKYLKTMELSDSAPIGVCAVIRVNTVFSHLMIGLHYTGVFTFTTLGANSAYGKLIIFFLFSQKTV